MWQKWATRCFEHGEWLKGAREAAQMQKLRAQMSAELQGCNCEACQNCKSRLQQLTELNDEISFISVQWFCMQS
jgi:hypothetical protein